MRATRTPCGLLAIVKAGASHWLVNANLKLAELSEPKRAWRILASDKHSTVWDGELTLFDMNFSAFRVPPEEAFALAWESELKPGKLLTVYFAEHYTKDKEWAALQAARLAPAAPA